MESKRPKVTSHHLGFVCERDQLLCLYECAVCKLFPSMCVYIYIYIAEKGPVVNMLEWPEVSDLSLSSMQDSLRVILACVISA